MFTEDDRPPPKTLPDLVREHTRIATGLAVAAFAILVMLITGGSPPRFVRTGRRLVGQSNHAISGSGLDDIERACIGPASRLCAKLGHYRLLWG